MNVFRRWKLAGRRIADGITRPSDAKIYIQSIEFSGGLKIDLNESSILVIVGPNNAGKSSTLRELRDHLQDGFRFGPVLRAAEIRVVGTSSSFKRELKKIGLATAKVGVLKIGFREYDVEKVDEDIKRSFVGSPIIPFFVSYLGAEERLKITDPTRREDYILSAPKNPMQWLELDEGAESHISGIFEKTFDAKLILNTLAGENLMLHIIRNDDALPEITSTREAATWLAGLPRLHRQGDGMRSFAGTMMSLLVHPTSTILLDEPEAFLHPPQTRRLAEVIAREVPGGCQVIVATHNDSFLRALLDSSGARVTLVRIVREGKINKGTVLNQSQLAEMWSDPLLRTSDVLSSLFHEVAILSEGESDARFYGALLDATRGDERDPDARIFQFGGKDRIASIARALRLIGIPVVVIVDIDILADRQKFLVLYGALGGAVDGIEKDVDDLGRLMSDRKGQMTGGELAVELHRVASDIEGERLVSGPVRRRVLDLVRDQSNWHRVKHDGYRALDAKLYGRISTAAQKIGLLINPEGELEGFCRTLTASRKSEWLSNVLTRNLATDADLQDARVFAAVIRKTMRQRITTTQG